MRVAIVLTLALIVVDYLSIFFAPNVGGPSAGLAFTLTIIDELSAGDLTGGEEVAVTGTIDGLGNVEGDPASASFRVIRKG